MKHGAFDEISVRGRTVRVPAFEIAGRTIVVRGRWLKVATVKDEHWIEDDLCDVAERLVAVLRSGCVDADLFAFSGPLDPAAPPLGFPFEADNAAVVGTSNFDAWWSGLPQEARKNARRAARRGVRIETAALDDAFAEKIKCIYDETPVRQDRPFWHYGKSVAMVRRENASYLDRSTILAAYHGDELIGFMKWVQVGDVARIMQILASTAHYDKRPMNALIAKAVEICSGRKTRYLVYGKFTYGNKVDSTIAEFKRRMGFTQLDFPRYHVALNTKGRLALKLGLHRTLADALPAWIIEPLRALRSRCLARHHGKCGGRSDGDIARGRIHLRAGPGS
jgi:hypothetical protein